MTFVHQSTPVLIATIVLSLLAGIADAEPPVEPEGSTLDAGPDASQFVTVDPDDLGQPPQTLSDLDAEPVSYSQDEFLAVDSWHDEWGVYGLPQGFIYRAYLASPKETRLGTALLNIPGDSTAMWDSTIGGKIALLRIGTRDPLRPRGFQVEVEASAQARLDLPEQNDVRATDYRFGLPFTWGDERHQWRFSYYHISSHLGDEFIDKTPGFPRFSQSRDALGLGYSHYLTDALRVYAEAGWAFSSNASEPWEFQFGVDYAPRNPTGCYGAPFVAVNGHLRQELNYGGGFTVQGGWAWRSDMTPGLLRMGLHYYNGASTQYSFLPFHEQQMGGGVWYDF